MSTRTEPSALRCWVARQDGVHVVDPETAARLIRESPSFAEDPTTEELVWVDIANPGDSEAAMLRNAMGVHKLAVEDCLRGRQRPKLDRYPGHFFIVFYATRMNPLRDRMALNELHLFLGANFLVTVHGQEVTEVDEMMEIWRSDPARFGEAAFIAYALLDCLVDNYFPVVEHFSDRLDRIEERILEHANLPTLHDAILLRHEMISMRRILGPERDLLSSFIRHDLAFARPQMVLYFQDVHDHILRVIEEIDAFRDLLTGLVEIQNSNASNRLNKTMQMLTAWSIILMSITVIAGIYGMNFSVMPELSLSWGYYAALGLMATTGILLIVFFRRWEWL